MVSKVALVVLLFAVACQAATLNKREVIVDGRGFYLGGGSNNNLREASQIFDLGGPIANPWLNAWTQPLPRSGIFPSPVSGAVAAPAHHAPAAPAYPAPAPTYQQPAPAYQQPAPAYQQPAPAYQAPAYQAPAPQYAPPAYEAPAYQPPAAPAYQAPAPQYAPPAYEAPAYQPPAYQAPAPQYAAPVYQPPAPALQPPALQPPAQQFGNGASSGAAFTPVAPVGPGAQVPSAEVSFNNNNNNNNAGVMNAPAGADSNKPFTAVFIPGQPTQFKLGTPSDFASGAYTQI